MRASTILVFNHPTSMESLRESVLWAATPAYFEGVEGEGAEKYYVTEAV